MILIIGRPCILTAIVTGLAIGLSAMASTAVAAPPTFTVSIQVGEGGIILSSTYPDMATCEAVPTANCYRFTDGTVVGQIAPFAALNQLLEILGIHTGGCTTIVNIGGGSPAVEEIYVGSAESLVIAKGSCTDLAREAASHIAVLATPFSPETIVPGIVSVEALSVVVAHNAQAHRAS